MNKIIEIMERITIYENPIPNLVSRHAYFPGLAEMPFGDIIALFPIGEAFEAMGNTVFVSRSKDRGKTWMLEGKMHPESKFVNIGPCSFKPTLLENGTVIAIGYGFYRDNPEVLLNPETGGLPKGPNLVSFSNDEGKTWDAPEVISLSRPETLETSGPCTQLRNGELISTGSAFPMWDGIRPSGRIGVLLRSKDNGKSWDDKTLFYNSGNGGVSAYETRSCQMPNGQILIILWLIDEATGKNLTNHVVVSTDNGATWSLPADTGIPGQASNLTPLQNNLLLSIHCYREGDVGLYVNVVDFSGEKWRNIASEKIWGGKKSRQIGGLIDMGKNLKFGQPSLLPLSGGEFLAACWAVENCMGKICAYRIRVNLDKL